MNRTFPPYRLMERDYLAEAQQQHARLERLYHKGQQLAWDGRALLREALARNGGRIDIPPEKKKAIGQVFTIILWGELAAWTISADLAEQLEDVEAKMAASGQVFDEARHFYTMRDYLLALDIELPPVDAFTRAVLLDLLETPSLVYKLLGMQLLVENVAVNLFKAVAKSGVEPVLCELMPYFERDEARHVGLGVMYLPKLLSKLTRWEGLKLQAFQIKINTFILWGSILVRDAMDTLGIDTNASFHQGLAKQVELMTQMGHFRNELPGLFRAPPWLHEVNERSIDLLFPPDPQATPRWQQTLNGVMGRAAGVTERVLAVTERL